jgi:hypothetical protein
MVSFMVGLLGLETSKFAITPQRPFDFALVHWLLLTQHSYSGAYVLSFFDPFRTWVTRGICGAAIEKASTTSCDILILSGRLMGLLVGGMAAEFEAERSSRAGLRLESQRSRACRR